MPRTEGIALDDPRVLALAALVKPELEAEAAGHFQTLQRIPSSGVIRLLDYIDTLNGTDRAALLEAQARVSALCFLPGPLIASAYEQLRNEPALARRETAMRSPQFSMGLRYCDLRMGRMMLNDAES